MPSTDLGEPGSPSRSNATTADPGGQATLKATVFSDNGTKLPNQFVTFTVVSGDGDLGAQSVTKVTDSQGVATTTLRIGSTPGAIVIQAEANGAVSDVIVMVAGEAASPPQSAVNAIRPPITGDAGLKH